MTAVAADPEMTLALEGAPAGSKRAQILAAAVAVFCELGYGAASMDAIARRANVSKATLYAHFTGKDQLFAAVVEARCGWFAAQLTALNVDRLPVREGLRRLGRQFIEFLLTPQALAFHRIVVAEAPRFPELGRIFFASGPKRVLVQFAEYLERAARRGELEMRDPRIAAQHFVELSKGSLHLCRVLCVPEEEAPQQDIDALVEDAVDVFCRAYAPRSKTEAPLR